MVQQAKTVLDVLSDSINEEKSSALYFLASGGAKDFATYKEVTGLIRGLELCMGYVVDLARKQLKDDDYD